MLSSCFEMDQVDVRCVCCVLLSVNCEHTVLPCCRAGPQQSSAAALMGNEVVKPLKKTQLDPEAYPQKWGVANLINE